MRVLNYLVREYYLYEKKVINARLEFVRKGEIQRIFLTRWVEKFSAYYTNKDLARFQ